MMEIRNARIRKASLGFEDCGCLMYWLTLEIAGGGVCGFGGYSIGRGGLNSDSFLGLQEGTEALMRIMDVVGVKKWEELEGKYCRVEDNGPGKMIEAIGNLMEDKWFDQEKFFENVRLRLESGQDDKEEA